jgi:uncharacterized repeat protein (TIGR01451 family)
MTQDHRFVGKKVFSALVIIFIITIIAALSGCTSTTPTTPTPTIPTSPPSETTPALTPEPELPATPLTILSVTGGDVFVKRAGTDNWSRAEVGTTLQPGDAIRSVNDSHAEITFFEGSTIELDGDTWVSLSEIGISDTGSTTIHLSQYFGNTVSRVKKLTDSASSYEIETQAAVAAVRGSTMKLTVLGDGTTVVTNEEGDIRVIAQGVEVVIPEGMHSSVTIGEAPGQPKPPAPPPPPPHPAPVYVASINTGVQADLAEADIGQTITYTYSISNTGNLQIQSVSLTDDVADTPASQGGDINENSFLDPGETWIYYATHVASADDPSPLVNTATFSVTVYGSTLVAEDHASVVILKPAIALTKTAEPPESFCEGYEVIYTYYVSNAGNVPLEYISLTDYIPGEVDIYLFPEYVSGNYGNESLDVGETWVYTATYTVIGYEVDLLTNAATAQGLYEGTYVVIYEWVSATAELSITVTPCY